MSLKGRASVTQAGTCQLKCELAAIKNVHVWIVNFPQRYFSIEKWLICIIVLLLYFPHTTLDCDVTSSNDLNVYFKSILSRGPWNLVSGKIDFYETPAKEAMRDKQNNTQTILQLKHMLTLYWGQKNLSVRRRVYTTKLYKTPWDINTNCVMLALTRKNKGKKWTIKFCEDNKHRKLKSGLGSNIRQTSAMIGCIHLLNRARLMS